ncbi:MAG: hemolysin family protein [Oculatellaceae cyanobacterium Prado106]|nr:hemolysin family protein [Oculatellaceae cyanobacterium Prado106]
MTTDILIVLVLTIANGIFSMSEMAVVSSRKVRLQELAERGDAKARSALELANSPNRFLSTVQVGITLITILTGVFGGATLAAPLASAIAQIPGLRESSGAIAQGLVVIFITYLSLIIGELVPKRLALNSPERIATLIAMPMRLVEKFTSPIVWFLSLSTDLLLRLMGGHRASDEPLITEEEIKVLMRQGTEAGTFEAAEQDMIERVFNLGDEPVSAIITPRLDIVWLDLSDSVEINRQKVTESHHSRYPVCQDSLDNVLGIVHVKDIWAQGAAGKPIDFTQILRQPLFVAESTDALKVLELFKKTATQIALVANEYGVTQGLVTLNDVVEVIIGDIPYAGDEEPEAVQREDGSWLVDGMISIDEFKELLDIEGLPGEERGNYQTLGGFVITQLGHIPRTSDHFIWKQFRFEVVDMDGNRVDKILVAPVR